MKPFFDEDSIILIRLYFYVFAGMEKQHIWQILKIGSLVGSLNILPAGLELDFFFCPKNIINNNQTCKIIDHAKTSERTIHVSY